MSSKFAALPGFYRLLFLYLEPLSGFAPVITVWITSGPAWFHREQFPSSEPAPAKLDNRTRMIISQLVNCYFLLGLLSTFSLRAIRDAISNDPAAQERVLGAMFLALGIADVTHVLVTFLCLPKSLRYHPRNWNSITHGNITFTSFLLLIRIAWFLGINRTRFYFGQPQHIKLN